MKRTITAAAALALAGGLLFAPTASADDEVVVPGLGSIDTDGATYVDADGETDGPLTGVDERLDGWIGVGSEGVCADSHGSRSEPDTADADYATDTNPDGYHCNEALLQSLGEG